VTWNWDPSQWKKSTKILLGIATIWPVVYMFLFIASIFSMFLFLPFASTQSKQTCGKLDVLQLDRKIKDGQIQELKIHRYEIIARERIGTCEYETSVSEDSTRQQIISDAREIVNGQPRVEVIGESTSEPDEPPFFVPLGFGMFMLVHLLTMLLMMGLMPLYIILAIKNEGLDQTMRIVWVVLACTIGMFANIVYWYLHIWRKSPKTRVPPA
jgi:hypothetical protein